MNSTCMVAMAVFSPVLQECQVANLTIALDKLKISRACERAADLLARQYTLIC